MSFPARMDMAPLLAKMDRVLPYLNKSRDDVLREESGSIVKKLINLSPPGSQGESIGQMKEVFVKGIAAKRQGENAIATDLLGGRRGHSGSKHAKRAGIFAIIDDNILANATYQGSSIRLFATADGTVYGCDRRYFYPKATIEDMERHHARYFKNGRMTTAGANTRDIGRWVFIDLMVVSKSSFARYLKHTQAKVGLYASSLLGAMEDLGAKGAPAFITRHRGKLGGSGRMTNSGDKAYVTIRAEVPFAASDMQRRMDFTLAVTMKHLPKRINHITRAALKKAGLTTAALT